MVKPFRLLEKKRGDRRTGSVWFGRIAELSFLGGMFLVGLVLLSDLLFSQFGIGGKAFFEAKAGFGFWLLVVTLSSFVIIGGGGLLWSIFHARTSIERRAAIVHLAENLELMPDGQSSARDFPTLPPDDNMANSPGTTLDYRLPTVETPLWQGLFAGTFAVVWFGLFVVLAVGACRGHMAGQPDWVLTSIVVGAGAVAIGGVVHFARRLSLHTGLGPTIVECSHHPLLPGRRYTLLVSQSGQLRMKKLSLSLVCEEEATYRQGTDVRTEAKMVMRAVLMRTTNFAITPVASFEREVEFSIPEEAMHSMQTAHNSIRWKLVVEGHAEGWPEFTRTFPLIVRPAPPAKKTEGTPTSRSARIATNRAVVTPAATATASIGETDVARKPNAASVVDVAPATSAAPSQSVGA